MAAKDLNADAEKGKPEGDTTGKGPAPNTNDSAVIEKEQKSIADIPQNEKNTEIVDGKPAGTVENTDTDKVVSDKIQDQSTGGLTKEAIDADLDKDAEFKGEGDDAHFEEMTEEEREYATRRPDPLDGDDLVQHPGQVFRNKTDQKVAYAPPGTYNAAMAGVQQDASGHFESIGKINSEKSGTRI